MPQASLRTIFKLFVRPHLDYGDVTYDQSYNSTFHQEMESIQYNTVLAVTGAIRGLSREKVYEELGLESLQQWRWNSYFPSTVTQWTNLGKKYKEF